MTNQFAQPTSTPLERERGIDLSAPAHEELTSLDRSSRFDTARYWYGLARTNAHTLALALAIVETSKPGDLYRAEAIETIRKMRREIALDVRMAESMTH